jgi:hypothetical protein
VSLRKATINVTDHASLRYRERVGHAYGDDRIVAAVRSARVLGRDEPLPSLTPRVDGTTYATDGRAVFVLRGIAAKHFELITVLDAKV